MTANTVFIIYDTAGVPVAAIQPNTLNGPGGVQQSSDLSMFGLGYVLWGQASDQNDYRLLENFACPQSILNPSPIQPMGTAELGNGNGINAPLVGQLWFNTTTQTMFMYTLAGWDTVTISVISTIEPVSPSIGELWYDTAIPQLEVWSGSAWTSVAALYLPLAGGTMTGAINMNGNNVTGVNITSTNTVESTAYQAPNGNTSNQITIPNSGATSLIDGPRIGPYIIYHTGNLPPSVPVFVTGMIMMWNSPTPPSGWAICDGSLGTPDLRDRFIVGAGLSYVVGSTGGGTFGFGTTLPYTFSGVTLGHTLALSEIPAHAHEIYAILQNIEYSGGGDTAFVAPSGGNGAYYNNQAQGVHAQIIQNSGGGGAHTHGISFTIPPQTVTVPIVPPFYGLYYIMKL